MNAPISGDAQVLLDRKVLANLMSSSDFGEQTTPLDTNFLNPEKTGFFRHNNLLERVELMSLEAKTIHCLQLVGNISRTK